MLLFNMDTSRGRCTKVHANLPGTGVDGCNEFMFQVLCDMCVACGCHKSFHVRIEPLSKRDFASVGVIDIACDGVEQNHKRICNLEVGSPLFVSQFLRCP